MSHLFVFSSQNVARHEAEATSANMHKHAAGVKADSQTLLMNYKIYLLGKETVKGKVRYRKQWSCDQITWWVEACVRLRFREDWLKCRAEKADETSLITREEDGLAKKRLTRGVSNNCHQSVDRRTFETREDSGFCDVSMSWAESTSRIISHTQTESEGEKTSPADLTSMLSGRIILLIKRF